MNDNVIPFKGRKETPAAAAPAPAVLTLEELTLQEEVVRLCNFFIENRDKVKYFVCGVGLDKPGDPTGVDFRTHSSTIEPSDYAFTLQLLQRSFNNLLERNITND